MRATGRELILAALRVRLKELCAERIARLRPASFGAHALFVSELQTSFSKPESNPAQLTRTATARSGWVEWEGGCHEALRRLAAGETLETRPGTEPPVEPFAASLYEARRKPEERFRLLTERYRCPLNIAADKERDVREHLLERLMVQERAQVESGSRRSISIEDVLLKLNLLAVYAARSDDLRYLDALNYYYELQESWNPSGPEGWLLASYLGLYARALSAWLNQRL